MLFKNNFEFCIIILWIIKVIFVKKLMIVFKWFCKKIEVFEFLDWNKVCVMVFIY